MAQIKRINLFMKRNKIYDATIIILTRNEIQGVRAIIPRIPKHLVKECFAVDFQSKDGTREYFQKHKIPVINQQTKGRGAAFAIGVQKAKGKYIVFFSPDGNEDPKDIPQLLKLLEQGYDLAIASRFMKGARNEEDDKVLKFRAWANQGFTLLANTLWKGHVTDSINGYRAMKKTLFNQLHLDATGFAIEYQMTIRVLKLEGSIGEIPTREGNRIGGESTSYAIPTGIEFLRFVWREIRIGSGFIKS
jgi:glycosyltransferase involved in cell wall biosynthesis